MRATASLDPFLGVPYDKADCVTITMAYLDTIGVTARDPRLFPEDWEKCDRTDAVVLTYRARTHVAPVVGAHIIETRKGNTSYLMRIDRLRNMGVEFWRPRA
jgi:hypothetical protein